MDAGCHGEAGIPSRTCILLQKALYIQFKEAVYLMNPFKVTKEKRLDLNFGKRRTLKSFDISQN